MTAALEEQAADLVTVVGGRGRTRHRKTGGTCYPSNNNRRTTGDTEEHLTSQGVPTSAFRWPSFLKEATDRKPPRMSRYDTRRMQHAHPRMRGLTLQCMPVAR
ncbi:Hypothetical protein NTJ_05959 [Nesidiocoris tenuis]|uniref:Uncharacterized protein n=1 Tax=Nesidiocoris tenuis TaxID=355587 RepID=A0ABN7AQF6_9HEMI|nr:Hypothetical protein NTJ_05959 [Nesidiocoris tenuis]